MEFLSANNYLASTIFQCVLDPPSIYSAVTETKLALRRQAFLDFGGRNGDIEEHELFERTERVVTSARNFIERSDGNIIFDVTSFPKRFFLPTLRLLLESKVSNLIVTYTVPEAYSRNALAEDPEAWRHIPLFPPRFPEPKIEVLVIGLGFETLGLPDLLEHDYHDVSLKLLFPFPPGPPSFQRCWEFVRRLEMGVVRHEHEPIRVPALDLSNAFDHILSATDNGRRYTILAPYGPKPISVAMSIFATLSDCPVYYTQPRAYNPEYCNGIKRVNGHLETYAYCIRLNSRNLYQLPK